MFWNSVKNRCQRAVQIRAKVENRPCCMVFIEKKCSRSCEERLRGPPTSSWMSSRQGRVCEHTVHRQMKKESVSSRSKSNSSFIQPWDSARGLWSRSSCQLRGKNLKSEVVARPVRVTDSESECEFYDGCADCGDCAGVQVQVVLELHDEPACLPQTYVRSP